MIYTDMIFKKGAIVIICLLDNQLYIQNFSTFNLDTFKTLPMLNNIPGECVRMKQLLIIELN